MTTKGGLGKRIDPRALHSISAKSGAPGRSNCKGSHASRDGWMGRPQKRDEIWRGFVLGLRAGCDCGVAASEKRRQSRRTPKWVGRFRDPRTLRRWIRAWAARASRMAVTSARLFVGGHGGHGIVVAAAVDVGDFAAHFADVGAELAAVMDGVVEHELQVEDRRVIEDTKEGDGRGPKFGREPRD